MPLSFAQIQADVRTINVSYFEHNFSVTYRPSENTPRKNSAAQELEEGGDTNKATIDTLCRVMIAWDVLGDDGKPLPITAETLGDMPYAILTSIVQAIGADGSPKPASAGKSFAR
jgi:hypothetical protein